VAPDGESPEGKWGVLSEIRQRKDIGSTRPILGELQTIRRAVSI